MQSGLSSRSWLRRGALLLVSSLGFSLLAIAQTSPPPPDTTAPVVAITTPTLDGRYNTAGFPTLSGFQGTTSDAESGVVKVDVALFREWSNPTQYWNGTSWINSNATTTATLSGNNWSLTTGLPSGADLPNGRYRIGAFSRNGANLTTSQYLNFFIGNDTTAPTGTIDAPVANANIETLPSLTGTVSDTGDSGLGHVFIQLNRNWSGMQQYWNGTAWVSSDPRLRPTLGTPSNGVTPWSFPVALPEGANLPQSKYNVYLQVFDRAYNNSAKAQSFYVLPADTRPPTATLTFPAPNAQLSRLTRITGTADDVVGTPLGEGASGVARVDVQLRRNVTTSGGTQQTQFWNGTAWTTTYSILAPRDEVSWVRNTGLPSGANLPMGSYILLYQATDRWNNNSPLITTNFSVVANRLPVAQAQNLTTSSGTSVNLTLSGTDADSDDLTYQIATPPANGTLSGTAPNLTYTPASGWQGSDSFTFTASDPDGASSPATVTINTLAPVALDASIMLSSATAWTGDGIANSNAAGQTTSLTSFVNTTRVFLVALRKSGGSGSETVRVTMPDAATFPAGWGLRFYEGATGSTNITSQVMGAGYPVVVTDTKTTLLRFEVDVPNTAANNAAASVSVRATQSTTSEIAASDTVKATTNARQVAQADLAVSRSDAAGVPVGTAVGAGVLFSGTVNQTLSAPIVAGQTHFFRATLTNTGTDATLFGMNITAPPTGWSTRVFNATRTWNTTSSTWNSDVIQPGASLSYIIEVKANDVTGVAASYNMALRATSNTLLDQVNVVQTLRTAATSPLDASIQLKGATTFSGEGVINTTGTNQQATSEGLPGTAMEFVAKVNNLTGSTLNTKFTAPASSGGWTVNYYDATGTEITATITGVGGWPTSLDANASTTVNIKVTAPATIPTPPDFSVLLQASVDGDASAADAVKATAIASNNVAPDLSIRLLSEYEPNAPWMGETFVGLSGGETMSEQKLTTVVMGGTKNIYLVRLKNTSTTLSGSFKLDLTTASSAWNIELFRMSDNALLAFDPQSGGPTVTVLPNNTLELRLEITSAGSVSPDFEVKLRASSSPQLLDQVSVVTLRQTVARLEWSHDNTNWYPVDAQHPPEVEQFATIGIRAIKSIVAMPWPFPEPVGPVWSWQHDTLKGETLWLQGKTVTPVEGEEVMALFGNKATAMIRVLPTYDMTLRVDKNIILAGAGPASLKTVNLSVRVSDVEDDTPKAGVKVRFRALNASGNSTGEVGTSLPSDDFVVTDSGGIATAVWTSGTDGGEIKFEAMALDEKGRERGKGHRLFVPSSSPYTRLTYGSWTQTNGLWSRSVTASAWFMGQKISGRALTLSSQVKDYETQHPVAGWQNAAPFDATTGTTNASGDFVTTQRWNPVDAGAWPHDYEITVGAAAN